MKIVSLIFVGFLLLVVTGLLMQLTASASGAGVGLQDYQLISVDEGWVLMNQRLYWTRTGGQSWSDITPPDLEPFTIQAAVFIDVQHGWLALIGPAEAGGLTYAIAQTVDGGHTWQIIPLSLFEPGDVDAVASAVYLHFLDQETGWLTIKRATSSNFSLGSLFKTTDGGRTWTRLAIPVGEPVYFITGEIGWTAGGVNGDELYRTQDGGVTWSLQTVEPLSTLGNRQLYQLPAFTNPEEGVLPIVVTNAGETGVALYATGDAGQSWHLAASVSLKGEMTPDASVPLTVLDPERSIIVIPDSRQILEISNGGQITTMTSQDSLVTGITQLEMVTAKVGWANYVAASCTSSSPAKSQPSLSSETIIDCSSETRLLRTEDGGLTWFALNLPGISAPAIRRAFTTTTSIDEPAKAFDSDKLSLQGIGSQTRAFSGQGFDKCEIATLSQLQNWVTNSPYRAVNLYIGGSSRACSNSALSASYLSQLRQQGWTFIPTWVGPQAACTGFSTRMSYNTTTAYNQGINEANAAINVAANLGLTLPDKTGTIIYYDLEGYDTTNAACRNAAKAFISGWTSQIQALGNESGVYGSACASALSDFAGISNVPNAIWPAAWIAPYQYRSDAAVWNVPCLSNSLWANHQRIRQYAGGHNETWGSVTLNIDSNVLDGIVADINDRIPPLTAVSLSGTLGESNWYRSNVQVTLSAQDNSGGSGVKLIQYKIDGGSWVTRNGNSTSFTVSGAGNHTVAYKAQDNAGNWESEKQTAFGIDPVAPTGSLAVNNNASVTHATLVYLNAATSDVLSGVSQMRIRNAGGTWTAWLPYSARYLWQLPGPTGQTFTVEIQFKDRAGNVSSIYQDSIPLDIYPAWPASSGYRLAKSTLGVSGGPSSSAGYRLRGTLGQPSAVSVMTGGGYVSAWGYWTAYSLALPGDTVYLPLILK